VNNHTDMLTINIRHANIRLKAADKPSTVAYCSIQYKRSVTSAATWSRSVAPNNQSIISYIWFIPEYNYTSNKM